MSSGRGLGRGAFLRGLNSTMSSDDVPKIPSQDNIDSGLGRTQPSPVDPNLSKSSGLTKDVSSLVSESSNPFGKGMGRARLLDSFSKLQDKPTSPSFVSSADSLDLVDKPIRMGRGALLASLRSTSITPESEVAAQQKEVLPVLQENMSQMSVKTTKTDSKREPVIQHGKAGRPIDVVCNYIKLTSDPNTGVYQYDVQYTPSVDSLGMRCAMLNSQIFTLGVGTKTFDGRMLFLPIKLPNHVTVLQAVNKFSNEEVEIKLVFVKQQCMKDCMQLYNVLFDRIMTQLKYVRFERKKYDPTMPKMIPQHKLEIWPGYVTAVDEYEGGVQLCLDVSHRVLCQTTVLESLTDIFRHDKEHFQQNALKGLLGSVVLTRYNNKTYRVDDIIFDQNPTSTFQRGDDKVPYWQYYKDQYNLEIRDLKQPLLLSRKERRVSGKEGKEELLFCLIPELCYLTGMTDTMRSDLRVMRDIATFTRVAPNQRAQALVKFCQNVNSNEEAKKILKQWGLTLDTSPINLTARALGQEDIIFSNKKVSAGDNADFNRDATNNRVLEAINLVQWLVIYTKNDSKYAHEFIDCMERNSRPMGIVVAKPQVHVLPNDRTETYVQALRSLLNDNIQVVVLICPTSRDDRYAAIKRICCAEIPVPSQVINAKTLSNSSKNRSIVQKIALQINCKMGGTLWSINIPFDNVMICGIDTFHTADNKGDSVSGFVASLNGVYTKWFSRAVIQKSKEELVNGLTSSLTSALEAYKRVNSRLPSKIIVFRDGVGDGQLNMCTEYELPQLQKACMIESDYKPEFTYIVVQKRINTRIFLQTNNELANPLPGAVLDHTVTRKYLFDFFLVSQSVRQGTVSPTHFVVIHDSAKFSPDILQRLSYKLCFLYYNWPGTIRVPACCQYAHKIAFLVGNSLKRHASEKLEEKLYYL